MWKLLAKTLVIEKPIGKVLAKPSLAAIRKVEHESEFEFPKSYISFIQELGAGELVGYFRIYGPGYDHSSANLSWLQKVFSENLKTQVKKFGNRELMERIVLFADSVGGDLIGWDPIQIRDKKKREYSIYGLPYDGHEAVLLSDNFPDFVKDVCLGEGAKRLFNDPNWNPPETFQPFGGA